MNDLDYNSYHAGYTAGLAQGKRNFAKEREIFQLWLEQYKWHDLRINEEDLPLRNKDVLVCSRNSLGKYSYHTTEDFDSKYEFTYDSYAIKWMYIPPFEE